MRELLKFYIDGQWVEPTGSRTWDVINPATEEVAGRIALGESEDVDRAVTAARKAFASYSRSTREERIALFERILEEYDKRAGDLAAAITEEMGAPLGLSRDAQAVLPRNHLEIAIENLKNFEFEKSYGTSIVRSVPIGVCGLITPWNWPGAVVMTKALPALAMGCTVVLKPSEYSPFSAQVIAEIFDAAGVPAGVFNLVNGDGPTVGVELSTHPQIDVVSFTGSTRAGIEVARNAAPSVKRVHQELGGKSPNVLLPSTDISGAVARGVNGLMMNSGQACSAPSRMIAPRSHREEVIAAARKAAEAITVGDPQDDPVIGPVVNKNQFERIQSYIGKGVDEGATLVAGGPGRPEGLTKGYYVRPTVFADVTKDMTVAKEEIFGPVLVIEFYDDIDEAVELANDTEYGLAAYLQGDLEEIKELATRIPAGQIYLNGSGDTMPDFRLPFGGLKKSGNGREWGEAAFEAFLEPVSLVGYSPTTA
ncbi:aldehyde dehydrogenase family protein [Rhodococcus erythropolis]|uniref:aldehyde dehydrogenase family protein n=1 Tax=Rhodococcus erythropolis TaxID=1833 RepID=UPI002226D845|nr:aldehyde dehydrogenase family protein [Rhodococcus erythropolis]MCW2295402.1 aldehyde dehydrogenase (NAD+) [Rhodococcus erythropolis]